MANKLQEVLQQEERAVASRPPSPSTIAVSSELGSPWSDPSMRISSFVAEDDSTERKKTKEEDTATPCSFESTKSGGGSGASEKSQGAGLAKKALEMCTEDIATPLWSGKAKKSVKLLRGEEASESALKQTTSMLVSYQRLMESSKESARSVAVMVEEAWKRLKKSFVYMPVGSLATVEALNYSHV